LGAGWSRGLLWKEGRRERGPAAAPRGARRAGGGRVPDSGQCIQEINGFRWNSQYLLGTY